MEEKDGFWKTLWQVAKVLFWVAVAVICFWWIREMVVTNSACTAAGKVVVQGIMGYECVSP